MNVLAIVVVVAIAIFLLAIKAYIPFLICVGEVFVFYGIFYMHIKGFYYVARYVFFVFAIAMQVFGSLYHGEQGGFDFLFFATAFSAILFFEKRWQYGSLFVLSIATYIAVKILYDYVEPILPLERHFVPYYINIVVSSLLIFLGYVLFKSEHLRYEEKLKEQRDKIHDQKEALLSIQDQMAGLLEARTKKLIEKNQDMIKYAYLNAHKARSPLARILGLVNLTKFEDLNAEEKRLYYFKELKTNAKDLDAILREISAMLNDSLENKT